MKNMISNYIDPSDERIRELRECIDRLRGCIWKLKDNARKRSLDNETYISDKELSDRLKVSRRTLQEWRNNGRISYILLGGKVLYKEKDIQLMLEKNYHASIY
jgi:excisionase family DNA binding protein